MGQIGQFPMRSMGTKDPQEPLKEQRVIFQAAHGIAVGEGAKLLILGEDGAHRKKCQFWAFDNMET
jgi:hypothetical protein